jgi:nicotinamide mononucleotide adenylyltransferase
MTLIKMHRKYALFIGRWQPYHKGHDWLIHNKLNEGKPVLIAVRDIPPDDDNPLTTEQTVAVLETAFRQYPDSMVQIMTIPDIESVNWGRGVGYDTIEHEPNEDIKAISATEIRAQLDGNDDSWRQSVPDRVHDIVEKYLGG